MIDKIISAAASIVAALLVAIYNKLKSKLSEKMQIKVEEIAVVVEALYIGCTSAEKLYAFKELCLQKGLNIKKAVKYLEEHIIPISKTINSYTAKDTTKKNKYGEATN